MNTITAIVQVPGGWVQQYRVAGRIVNGPSAPTRERLEEVICQREEILARAGKLIFKVQIKSQKEG